MVACGEPRDQRTERVAQAVTVTPSVALPWSTGQFHSEESVAVLNAVSGVACPDGAAIVTFNDTRTVGAVTSVHRLAGLAGDSWSMLPGDSGVLAAALTGTSTARTLGDGWAIALPERRRFLFVAMGSSLADGSVRDRIVLFRSDDCGNTWTALRVPTPVENSKDLEIDRPMIWSDTNGIVYVTFIDSYGRIWLNRSDDWGSTLASSDSWPISVDGTDNRVPVVAGYPNTSAGPVFLVWAHFPPCAGCPTRPTDWYISWSTGAGGAAGTWSTATHINVEGTQDLPRNVTSNRVANLDVLNDFGASFAVGANGHCVAAYPWYDAANNSQRIRVRESADGVAWNWVYDSPLAQPPTQHDAFYPRLMRRDRDTGTAADHQLVLAYYGTDGDPNTPGAAINVFATSSPADGAGMWGGVSTITGLTSNVVPFRLSNGYFGEYLGGAAYDDPQNPTIMRFLVAWHDSRPDGTATHVYSTRLTP